MKKRKWSISLGVSIVLIILGLLWGGVAVYKENISHKIPAISEMHTGFCENRFTERISVVAKEIDLNEMVIREINRYENKTEETVIISILGKETLIVKKSRIKDDIYGAYLDNQWELEEINTILTAIKGKWKVEQYVGFVPQTLFDGDLFEHENVSAMDPKDVQKLRNDYEEVVDKAQKDIPDVTFSIKETWTGEDTNSNYIWVNGNMSPVSIILSINRMNDYYPAMVERTTYSNEFLAEYPVLYIQFYIWENKIQGYERATLVITKDNKFYFLKDGAFYSIEEIEK